MSRALAGLGALGRRRAWRRIHPLAWLLAAAACSREPAEPAAPRAGADRAAGVERADANAPVDPRVQSLLAACPSVTRYEKDTSWIVPILVEKLAGEPAPARMAQDQLALLGPEAMEECLRFVRAHYADAFDAPLLESAMAAAGKSPEREARTILLLGLEHPQEVVRTAALEGLLAGHTEPADLDELALRLELPEPPTFRRSAARGMFRADFEGARERWIGWLGEGRYPELWKDVAPLLVEGPPLVREQGERLLALAADAPPAVARALTVAAFAAGAPGAERALTKLLETEDPDARLRTVQLVATAGQDDLLVPLRDDEDAHVRVAVLGALGSGDEPPADEERRAQRIAWLEAALDDPLPSVRFLALERLCAWRVASATDRALAQVREEGELAIAALRALRPRLLLEPELAARTLALVAERERAERHLPLSERIPSLKAIGLVPGEGAAQLLLAIARRHAGETLQGLRVHEWIAIQAGNTGVPGRRWLAAELAREEDPLRRVDLLDAVASVPDELARETLLEALSVPAPGHEALYAASRLVRLGPAGLAASRIKRAALDTPDGEVRQALWCLLWRWY